MFSVSLKRKTRNLEQLIKKMEKLSEEKVETGVFAEQGEHPTAEMSYVDLAIMHEQGDGDFPPRTVRNLTLNSMKNREFLNKVSVNLESYLLKDGSLNYSLGRIGQSMSHIGRSFFGSINPPDMMPNEPNWADEKGKNAPLVDQGYLQDAWAYRTSVNDYIVAKDFS